MFFRYYYLMILLKNHVSFKVLREIKQRIRDELLPENYVIHHQDEVFIDCVSRIGLEPFKEEVYGKKEKSA